ncbi:hypothetical protein OAO87_03625 [bacterium]|nr:hypothetical protein [bacterium]
MIKPSNVLDDDVELDESKFKELIELWLAFYEDSCAALSGLARDVCSWQAVVSVGVEVLKYVSGAWRYGFGDRFSCALSRAPPPWSAPLLNLPLKCSVSCAGHLGTCTHF